MDVSSNHAVFEETYEPEAEADAEAKNKLEAGDGGEPEARLHCSESPADLQEKKENKAQFWIHHYKRVKAERDKLKERVDTIEEEKAELERATRRAVDIAGAQAQARIAELEQRLALAEKAIAREQRRADTAEAITKTLKAEAVGLKQRVEEAQEERSMWEERAESSAEGMRRWRAEALRLRPEPSWTRGYRSSAPYGEPPALSGCWQGPHLFHHPHKHHADADALPAADGSRTELAQDHGTSSRGSSCTCQSAAPRSSMPAPAPSLLGRLSGSSALGEGMAGARKSHGGNWPRDPDLMARWSEMGKSMQQLKEVFTSARKSPKVGPETTANG